MARLPTSADVSRAPLSNPVRVQDVPVDNSGAALVALGRAGEQFMTRVRDQQIENDVLGAENRARRQLDELTNSLRGDNNHATYEQRWADGANRIVEENTATLRSPAHQRLWRERMNNVLLQGTGRVREMAREGALSEARGGLISNLSTATATLSDQDATPETRQAALGNIRTMVQSAIARGTIDADEGARQIASAENAARTFERTEGMRVQSQTEEDRIWAASGGNLAAGLEMARELNGEMRDLVTERLMRRASNERAAENEATDNAQERALTAIESGRGLSSISQADRSVLTRSGHMDELRNYETNYNGVGHGVDASSSRRTRDEIEARAVDNPAWFQSLDLSRMRTQLNASDYTALRNRQNGASSTNLQAIDEASRSVWRMAQYSAPTNMAVGSDMGSAGAGASDNERRQATQLAGFLRGRVQAFMEAHGRAPNAQEAQQIVDMAFLETNTGGLLGRRGRVYQAGPQRRVAVQYDRIPQYDRDRIIRALRASGRPFTNNDVVQIYANEISDTPDQVPGR